MCADVREYPMIPAILSVHNTSIVSVIVYGNASCV